MAPKTAKQTERAFCLKCGHTIDLKHGTAEDNECAKCGSEMAPLTNKLVKLKPINIFRIGKWKGFTYTIKHLDEMVQNFKDGVMRAYLKITEDGNHGSIQRPLLSSLAFGWVDELKREGERLFASFKQVPEAVAKLITGGALKQKSIEVWPDYHTTDGKPRGACLECILVFGTGLPGVHDLEEAAEMFTEVKSDGVKHEIAVDEMTSHDPGDVGTGDTNNKPDSAGGRSRQSVAGKAKSKKEIAIMDEVEILKAEIAKLKAKAELASLQSQEDANKAREAITAERDAMEVERDAALKKYDELQTAFDELRKSKVEEFVAEVIKTGQLEPARKDAVVAELMKLTVEQSEDYRKRLKGLPSLFKTDAVATGDTDPPSGEPDDLDSENRDKAIKAAMKADKDLTYTEADERLFGGGGGRLV